VGWIAVAIHLVVLGTVLAVARARDGAFAYPLDDPYIHLRLAENLLDGTLGMNPGQFASASSSPLWPVLIAGVAAVTGPLVGVPLALATVAGAGLLLGVDRWAKRIGLGVGGRSALMAAVLLLVPLTAVTLTGMEHVLQAGLCFLFASLVVERVCQPTNPGARPDRHDLFVLLTAAAAAAVRFELAFVLAPAVVLLAWRRRWWTIAAACIGAAIPVVATAAVNLGQGWPALPTPLIAKSITGADSEGITRLLPGLPLPSPDHVRVWAPLLLLAVVWVVSQRSLGPRWPLRATAWNAVALGTVGLHYAFVKIGWFYRYEAYLVVLLLGALAVSLHALVADATSAREAWRRTPIPARLAGAVLVVVALIGSLGSFSLSLRGMSEVQHQQVQMARFAAEHCTGCTVVVNDIGAVSMYGGGRIVDDYGLASDEVLDSKLDGSWDAHTLGELASREGATLAMVYDTPYWLPGVPEGWELLGTWSLDHAWVVGEETVSFYSLDPARSDELRDAFERFEPPPGVEVHSAQER
jgi:hypothetical protein